MLRQTKLRVLVALCTDVGYSSVCAVLSAVSSLPPRIGPMEPNHIGFHRRTWP